MRSNENHIQIRKKKNKPFITARSGHQKGKKSNKKCRRFRVLWRVKITSFGWLKLRGFRESSQAREREREKEPFQGESNAIGLKFICAIQQRMV